jgi:hypothetical protein
VNKRCQTTNLKQHSGAKRSVSAAVGEQMDGGKNFMACLHGPVKGVQKKEKDHVLHEDVLNVQDPCFFGRLKKKIADPIKNGNNLLVLPTLAIRYGRFHSFLT